MPIEISPRDARRLALQSQGLMRDNSFGRGKAAVARAVARLAYVQIDTISVVERAHHHVLRTRVGNYHPSMLDRLQSPDRTLFEYWFHAASYLPLADYRYYLSTMEHFRRTRSRPAEGEAVERDVLARIRAEGPLQSKDFGAPVGHRSTGWWNWKPAKAALERLFLYGELMVVHREQFQKVYDLRERVLPADLDLSTPDLRERDLFLIRRVIDSHGLATAADVRRARPIWTGGSTRQTLGRLMLELVEEGELVAANLRGTPYFTTPRLLEQLPLRFGKRRVTILSPFDNLVIERARALELFGFDYTLECYVPAPRREYGYFALPILFGDRLIGRMDCKAHRDRGMLQIRNLVFEDRVRQEDTLLVSLTDAITRFSEANQCTAVRLDQVDPASWQVPLRRLLR